MGSGISLTQKQVIEIVRRELDRLFKETESNRRRVDDFGILLPETFDHEEIYIKNIRHLDFIQPGKK
jgi:hypothetical protein